MNMKNKLMKSIVIAALIFLLIVPSVTTLYGNAKSANSPQASVSVEQAAFNSYLVTIFVHNNSTLFAYDTVVNNVSSMMTLFEGNQIFYLNITANTLFKVFEAEGNTSLNFVEIYSQYLTYSNQQVPAQITVTPYGTDYNVSVYFNGNITNYSLQIQMFTFYGAPYNNTKTLHNMTLNNGYYNFTLVPGQLGWNWYEYTITVWEAESYNRYVEIAYMPIIPVQLLITYTMSNGAFHFKMYFISANNMPVNISLSNQTIKSFIVHGNREFLANQSVIYNYNLSYLEYTNYTKNDYLMGMHIGGFFNVTLNGTTFGRIYLPPSQFLSYNTTNNTNTTVVTKMPSTPLALTVFNTAMLFGMLFWLAAFSYAFLSQNGKKPKYTKSQLMQLNIFPVISIINGAVVIASGVEAWYGQGTIWVWIGGISSILFVSVLYFFLFYSLWSTPSTASKQPVLTTKMKMGREEKSKKGGN